MKRSVPFDCPPEQPVVLHKRRALSRFAAGFLYGFHSNFGFLLLSTVKRPDDRLSNLLLSVFLVFEKRLENN